MEFGIWHPTVKVKATRQRLFKCDSYSGTNVCACMCGGKDTADCEGDVSQSEM